MANVFVDVGMSLDGFMAGPNGRPGNPLGAGIRCHDRQRCGAARALGGEGTKLSLSLRQVTEALRVNIATVDRGVTDGKVPHVRVGNTIRIPVRAT